jgi:hypothetical protein
MIATSEEIDWRLILPSFTFSNQEHHEKRINISIQEYHEKRINNANSRAPRKKESICQFKNTMKKGSIMSIQEHHEKKDQYVKSRASRKKGSICQIKSTTKKRINMSNQMCPNHRTYASLPTTLIATSEVTRAS